MLLSKPVFDVQTADSVVDYVPCRITVLPAFLNTLSGLEILRAGCNPIEHIDEELFEGLPQLREMDIGYSEVLCELPDSFHFLTNLKILHAGNGRVSMIPSSLFQCKNLEELHLYGNCVKEISEEIGCLINLKVLNLGRNQMTQLPKALGQCESLEVLHVYENCLSALPESVARLQNLKSLNYMSNANMPVPPREVRHTGKARDVAAFLGTGKVN